jgi:hypothetical protein
MRIRNSLNSHVKCVYACINMRQDEIRNFDLHSVSSVRSGPRTLLHLLADTLNDFVYVTFTLKLKSSTSTRLLDVQDFINFTTIERTVNHKSEEFTFV